MVASRQVEIPYNRAVIRQRGRGFGALAQVIGRSANPFLQVKYIFTSKYIVSAAKRVGPDLLEFAVPEIAEVVSDRENFNTAAKSVGKQTLKKQLGEGKGSRRWKGAVSGREFAYGWQGDSRKRTASRIIPTKSTKQSSRSRGDIFTIISR